MSVVSTPGACVVVLMKLLRMSLRTMPLAREAAPVGAAATAAGQQECRAGGGGAQPCQRSAALKELRRDQRKIVGQMVAMRRFGESVAVVVPRGV
ncbi:hypothetical protein LJR130_005009 [Variovorax sp. LjRoot130]|uniref:hypothetical protein n=1 Tax=Variovorax sp. LjRoot130 TaxID=3342261 RepID=UPI003ECC6F06